MRSVIVIIRNKKGDVLVVRQSYGRGRRGYWTFPGGICKKNEFPVKAARREVEEEVAISLHTLDPFGVLVDSEEHQPSVVYFFTAEAGSMSFKIDNIEICEARWVALNNLPPLTGTARRAVMLYEEKLYEKK